MSPLKQKEDFIMRRGKMVVFIFFLLGSLMGGMLSIGSAQSVMKIGYIDLQKVFQEYEKTKEFNEKLQSMNEQAQRTLKEGRKSLEDLQNQFETQKALLTESAQQRKLKEIEEKAKELEDLTKSTQETLQKQQELYTQEIIKDILSVIDEIAQKEGWRLILDKSNPCVLYPRPEVEIPGDEFDLTEKVILRLNEKYKAEK